MSDEHFMRLAIDKTRQGLKAGQMPFGAVIVRDGEIVACEHNVVWATMDITAHAEVTAIRKACLVCQSIDLSGCCIYSTTEPCPMCFSACHWAKLDRIVYGAEIDDARAAGFSELPIGNLEMKRQGGSKIEIVPRFLHDEAVELFRIYSRQAGKRSY
ncbi:MAG TPA: nucleoside deaminase [Tepidisphaeraceae bacterium]|jgi:tRNA(Arg) A34 adenosine deaminase TadA|nr:nucleoside deaminase [Tepidisphaeraceae bacterium]